MASNNLSEELSEEQKNLSSRIFDLINGRVLKRAYSDFDEKVKENMAQIFSSVDDKKKEEFIKKNIPNFKKLFKEEAEKIEEEIRAEIEILVAPPL